MWTLETAVSRRTDFEIADAVSAISAAPDPKACSRIFRKAIAAFKIDAFVCGEIDLAALERAVFYAIGWPDTWHKFYVGVSCFASCDFNDNGDLNVIANRAYVKVVCLRRQPACWSARLRARRPRLR